MRVGALGVGALGAGALLAGCMSWSTEPTNLGTLGGRNAAATAINDAGWIVGGSDTPTAGAQQAFVWHAGALTGLASLGGLNGRAESISANSWIVGQSQTGAGDAHATLWRGTTATDLGTLGGNTSDAVAINGTGWVVGTSDTNGGTAVDGFLWHDGTMTDLNALTGATFLPTGIADDGTVVGDHQTPSGTSPAVLKGTTVTDLQIPAGDADSLPSHYGTADAINSSGDVAGSISNHEGQPSRQYWHVVIWKHDGTVIEVAKTSNQYGVRVGGINNSDQVAWSLPGPNTAAEVWSQGSNHLLNPPCPPATCSNLSGRSAGAYGINNYGAVVGWAATAGKTDKYPPAPAALWNSSGSLSLG